MSLADIGAQIANDALNQVTRETFGHLAPVHRRVYQGEVLFANADIAGEGQPIIRTDFPGLDSSPWFYDALTEYFGELASKKLKPGTVAKWTGTYVLFKNGNSRFSGKARALNV